MGKGSLLAAFAIVLLFVPTAAALRFVDVQDAAGVEFDHTGPVAEGEDHAEFIEVLGSGACWADLDGDGYEDLFLVNQLFLNDTWNEERDPHAKLFVNEGDRTFSDRSVEAGVDFRGWGQGCSAADYDGDRDLDLFLFKQGGLALYHNLGDLVFEDRTAEAGFDFEAKCGDNPCLTTSGSWGDYDRDGDLDLYVTNFVDWDFGAGLPSPNEYAGQPCLLWQNQGDATFLDVTTAANAAGEVDRFDGHHFQSLWFDYNRDGWLDLSLAEDGTPDNLLRNNGDGTFTNVGAAAGIDDRFGSMGADFTDENGDGWIDFVNTNFLLEHNDLYLNDQDGTFTQDGGNRGLGADLDLSGWGTGFHDFDHDGDEDLYVANGVPTWDAGIPSAEENLLFRKDGTHYTNLGAAAGPAWDAAVKDESRSSGVADYDLDGDLDLAISNVFHGSARVLEQEEALEGNWLVLQLEQPGPNRWGIGAEIVVRAAGLPDQLRWVKRGNSFMGHDWLPVHVGLGDAAAAEVEVRWPLGGVDVRTLAANQVVRLVRGVAEPVTDTLAPRTRILESGMPGDDGWWLGGASVRLEAADRGVTDVSGVAGSEIRLPGGGWAPFSDPIPLADDGEHRVSARSTDLAGNAEPARHLIVRVDATAPESRPQIQGSEGRAGWWASPVSLSLAATDATSGVRSVSGRVDGGEWVAWGLIGVDEPGWHTFEHFARDVAGNEETLHATGFGVDLTIPEVRVTEPFGLGVALGDFAVRAEASDALSGVAQVEFFVDDEPLPRFVDADGADGYEWVAPAGALSPGAHPVQVRALDQAGNEDWDTVVVFAAGPFPAAGPSWEVPFVLAFAGFSGSWGRKSCARSTSRGSC